MKSYQNWSDWKIRRILAESKSQSPNYAFDNWLKMTKNFGDDISSFVGQARDQDKKLDDEIEKKKKEKEPDKKDDTNADDSEIKNKEAAWKKIKDIAKERMKKKEEDKRSE